MLSHAAIAGSSGEGVYAQTIVSGNFFIVLLLLGDKERVNLEIGRDSVTKIEEAISQNPQVSPKELAISIREQLGSDISLSLVVANIVENNLSLATLGSCGTKLIRKGKIINLTAPTLSGTLSQDDVIVLGTEKLMSKINFSELTNQSNKNPTEIRDALLPNLEGEHESPDICGLVLKFDQVVETEVPKASIEQNDMPQKSEESGTKIEEEATSVEEPLPTTPPNWGKISKVSGIFSGLTKLVPTKENIMYLKQAREKGFESAPPKKTLYLVLIAFVTLLSVIAFQLRSRSLEVQTQNVARIQAEANESLEASGKLIGLNDQLARQSLVDKKKEIVSEIERDFGSDWKNLKSKEGDQLRAIVAKYDQEIARAGNINSVPLTTFYDFSLLKPNPNITSAKLHDGTIMALDGKNGSVYSLGTSNKSGTIVAGGNFKSNSLVDFYSDNLYVHDSSGIKKKDLTTSGGFKTIAKDASSSGEITAMSSFGGNLYLLDPGNSQVWKYQGTEEGGFGEPVPYIQPGTNLDLLEANGMEIDGFIYVFEPNAVWKFASGAPEQLELKSLPSPIGSFNSMYSSDEEKNIYIWDAMNNRVVVVNKEGLYQAQYQLPTIKNAEKAIILADEEEKKIFLVSGSKVYGINMK